MGEPHASGAAIAGAAITFSGSVIGMHFDALLAGFAGGLVALSFLPGPLSVGRVAATLLSSSLLAGFFAQLVALGAFAYLPWTQPMGDLMRVAAAGGLGIASQTLIPVLLAWIERKGGAQ